MLFESQSAPDYRFTLQQSVSPSVFSNFQSPREDDFLANPDRKPHELFVTITFSFYNLPPQSSTIRPLRKEKYQSGVFNPKDQRNIKLSPQRFSFEDKPIEITVQVTTQVGQKTLFNCTKNYLFPDAQDTCKSSFRLTCEQTGLYQVAFDQDEPN